LLQESNKSSNFIIFLLLLTANSLLWVKQEGFFYFLFLNLIFFFHYKNNFSHGFYFTLISSLFLFFFIFVKIYYFESLRFGGGINSNFVDNLNPIILFQRISLIIKYIMISFIKYPIWIIIIFSSIILFFKYNFFDKFYFLYTFIFLTFTFIFLIFIYTPDDLNWLLPLTLSRLVFPISGFYIFLIIILLNKLKI